MVHAPTVTQKSLLLHNAGPLGQGLAVGARRARGSNKFSSGWPQEASAGRRARGGLMGAGSPDVILTAVAKADAMDRYAPSGVGRRPSLEHTRSPGFQREKKSVRYTP